MTGSTADNLWLYESGESKLADDPITWSDQYGDYVSATYAEAAYS